MRRALLLPLALLTACAAGGVSRPDVELAVSTTFGHRVAATEGASPGAATSSCTTASGGDRGAGDWSCVVRWAGQDGLAHAAEYDLQVSTDGCFRASLQTTPTGTAVPGPSGFDGCVRPG